MSWYVKMRKYPSLGAHEWFAWSMAVLICSGLCVSFCYDSGDKLAVAREMEVVVLPLL